MQRVSVPLTLLLVVGLLTFGCGDGNDGGVGLDIGPGPGPMAVPTPPAPPGGVNTMAAQNAPHAADPDPDEVRVEVLNLLDDFADDPPGTQAEMQALLDALAVLVAANPNDAAAQLALALATGLAGLYNTAIDIGVPPEDVFAALPELFGLFTAQAKGPDALPDLDYQKLLLRPITTMTGLYLLGPQMLRDQATAKAVIPGLEDEGITTEAIQIAIRNYLLPALYSGISRAQAIIENADPATDPVIVVGAGPDAWGVYPADIAMVLAFMHAIRADLHELIAYQLNWGAYDWEVDIVTRDANADGILTVDEYAPPDPFLWLHPAPNMQLAGGAIQASINSMVWAIQNRGTESLAALFVQESPWTGGDMVRWLQDLRRMLTQQVDVEVLYENVVVAEVGPAATDTITMNLGAIYTNPIQDIKDLLPQLHVVCDLGDCWPEINDENDFPDPSFNGVFPDWQDMLTIAEGDYNHIVMTYNDIEIPLVDPDGGFGFFFF